MRPSPLFLLTCTMHNQTLPPYASTVVGLAGHPSIIQHSESKAFENQDGCSSRMPRLSRFDGQGTCDENVEREHEREREQNRRTECAILLRGRTRPLRMCVPCHMHARPRSWAYNSNERLRERAGERTNDAKRTGGLFLIFLLLSSSSSSCSFSPTPSYPLPTLPCTLNSLHLPQTQQPPAPSSVLRTFAPTLYSSSSNQPPSLRTAPFHLSSSFLPPSRCLAAAHPGTLRRPLPQVRQVQQRRQALRQVQPASRLKAQGARHKTTTTRDRPAAGADADDTDE